LLLFCLAAWNWKLLLLNHLLSWLHHDETIVVDSDVEMENASSALTIVVVEDGLSLAYVTPEASKVLCCELLCYLL
jgi:hypothetical protein